MAILLLAIKVWIFLCMSQKLLQTQTKRNHNVWKNMRQNRRTADALLLTDPCWTPNRKRQNTAVIMTDAQPPGLLIACSSYFEVMVLLIFWFSDYRGRGGLKKWSLSVVFMPVLTSLSKCVWVRVLYMVWQKSWFSNTFLDIIDVNNRTCNKMVILFP